MMCRDSIYNGDWDDGVGQESTLVANGEAKADIVAKAFWRDYTAGPASILQLHKDPF